MCKGKPRQTIEEKAGEDDHGKFQHWNLETAKTKVTSRNVRIQRENIYSRVGPTPLFGALTTLGEGTGKNTWD